MRLGRGVSQGGGKEGQGGVGEEQRCVLGGSVAGGCGSGWMIGGREGGDVKKGGGSEGRGGRKASEEQRERSKGSSGFRVCIRPYLFSLRRILASFIEAATLLISLSSLSTPPLPCKLSGGCVAPISSFSPVLSSRGMA